MESGKRGPNILITGISSAAVVPPHYVYIINVFISVNVCWNFMLWHRHGRRHWTPLQSDTSISLSYTVMP